MKRLSRSPLLLALVPFLGLVTALPCPGADRTWNLSLGDPARKEKTVSPILDGVTDLRTGDALTPSAAVDRLKGVRLLFVGESHTEMEVHRMQLRVLQELRRAGRRVHVGLEMYPYTEQSVLDEWNGGRLTEEAFVRQSRWYKNWGYHWDYYREIFSFARDAGIPLHGVNTPREVLTAVRTKGFDKLTPEEASRIPPRIDTDSAEGKSLFAANFSTEDSMHGSMTPEQLDGMFRAQCTWDATMAYNAVRALKTDPDPNAIMVVLIGSGHVVYGLGAERQARTWFDGKTSSIVAVPVRDDKDAPVVVRASVADFVWGLPRETDPVFPVLGLSTREVKNPDRLVVIALEKDGIAAASGFRTGDELISLDDKPVPAKDVLALLMAGKRWADAATFKVKRGSETLSLTPLFRRKLEPEKKPETTEGKPKA